MIRSPFNASPRNLPYTIADAAEGRLVLPPHVTRPEKVAIIGASLTKKDAPLLDPEWEVWGLNNLILKDDRGAFRGDRWFEIHPMDVQSKSDIEFIEGCPVPLYMIDLYKEVDNPRKLKFPLEQILKRFPIDFFACTFCYQIALALSEGFPTIGLFGVDLDKGTARERAIERATVAFWLGLAAGMGRQVVTPDGCDLLRHPYRYGYDYHEEKAWVEAWMEPIAVQAAPWER